MYYQIFRTFYTWFFNKNYFIFFKKKADKNKLNYFINTIVDKIIEYEDNYDSLDEVEEAK